MIQRADLLRRVFDTLAAFPICALLGPRQSGKTTLARQVIVPRENYFDLENPLDSDRLRSPIAATARLKGLIVIDEIQQRPDLFPILRVLADEHRENGRFLILGSASPSLVSGASESLAGRVGFIEVSGFHLGEVGGDGQESLWLRGGFPRSFLAPSEEASYQWRQAFIQTFLTRDIPQYGLQIPAENLRRFWLMLAHYHGQTWNASEIAASMAMNYKTVQRYLDILAGAFMVRVLPPWIENLGKRLRKAPKIYFRDSGVLHALLGVRNRSELLTNPRLGASWEGFALEELFRQLGLASDEVFSYATHAGAELDAMVFRGGRRIGFEVKYADSPRLTPSMRSVMADLDLHSLYVIYPGPIRFAIDEKIQAIPLQNLHELRDELDAPITS